MGDVLAFRVRVGNVLEFRVELPVILIVRRLGLGFRV